MDELAKARSAANELADKSAAIARTLTPMGDAITTAEAMRQFGVSVQKFANAFQALVEMHEPK